MKHKIELSVIIESPSAAQAFLDFISIISEGQKQTAIKLEEVTLKHINDKITSPREQ